MEVPVPVLAASLSIQQLGKAVKDGPRSWDPAPTRAHSSSLSCGGESVQHCYEPTPLLGTSIKLEASDSGVNPAAPVTTVGVSPDITDPQHFKLLQAAFVP